jgi:hypothetical protein
VLVATAAGIKKANNGTFGMGDFFPRLRPTGPSYIDPDTGLDTTTTVRGSNVIDLPLREGSNEVESGWDRWVEMCRQFARDRGG